MQQHLRMSWTDGDLAQRDKQYRGGHRGAHFADEDPAVADYQDSEISPEDDMLAVEAAEAVDADDEDVHVLQEAVVAAADHAATANRTWEEARRWLNEVTRARGYYPVVGLAALPAQRRDEAYLAQLSTNGMWFGDQWHV